MAQRERQRSTGSERVESLTDQVDEVFERLMEVAAAIEERARSGRADDQ